MPAALYISIVRSASQASAPLPKSAKAKSRGRTPIEPLSFDFNGYSGKFSADHLSKIRPNGGPAIFWAETFATAGIIEQNTRSEDLMTSLNKLAVING